MRQDNAKKDRIPILRENLNKLLGDMSTTDFAKKVGLTRQTMGFYLNGDRIPDSETLRQICQKCNVSADWLLGLSEDPSPAPCAVDALGLSPTVINEIKRYKEIAPWRLSGLNTFLEATLPTNLFNEIDILRHKIVSESDTKPSTIELENAELYSKFGKSRADALVMQQLEDKLISQYPDLKGRISVKLSSFNIKEIYDGIIHDFKRCLGDMTGYNNFLNNLS